MPVSRLREAQVDVPRFSFDASAGEAWSEKIMRQNNGFVTAGKLSAKFPAMRPLR
jgi:hypothetical protein